MLAVSFGPLGTSPRTVFSCYEEYRVCSNSHFTIDLNSYIVARELVDRHTDSYHYSNIDDALLPVIGDASK